MIVDFRLQVFVTTARELSFTRTAEELNVSQPAVTKHIKELERLLSTPLFRRSGNRISLSAGGERLLPLAKSILSGYDRLNEEFDESCDGDSLNGRLRLGASTTITQYILPEILAKFSKSYPRIEITLKSGNSEEILRGIDEERIDLALVEDAHSFPAFHYEKFANDRVVLVSANRVKHPISIDEIEKLPLILRENGSGTLDVVERELAGHNISRRSLNVVMQIGNSEGIVRYLKASKCYAFISQAAVEDYLQREELYLCEIEGVKIERELRFAMLHGTTHRLVELFKEFCLSSTL
ncbi:MAG: LysR substrate-binding domain-containing protein [Rikenellaceae bacterium]